MKYMKFGIYWIVILAMLLTTGCAFGLRNDGGDSASYITAGGKHIRGPQVGLGPVFVSLFDVKTGVTNDINEPTISAAASVGSKTAAEDLAIKSERTEEGSKVVSWGAASIGTEAQDVKQILQEINNLRQVIPLPTPEE